jgi:hypothetical protein
MAAALQRTIQKCTSERADQRISVQFRTMTTILATAWTDVFLLPTTGILDCTGTYGPVQAPIEKTQNHSVQTVTRSVLLHYCEPYSTSKTEGTRNFWKDNFKANTVRWKRQESGECGTIVNYTTPFTKLDISVLIQVPITRQPGHIIWLGETAIPKRFLSAEP